MDNKSNSVDTFIKFILADKAASHQLQLFTSKPKSKLFASSSMQLHITHTTTALAVKALFIKLQNISTCRHRILHNSNQGKEVALNEKGVLGQNCKFAVFTQTWISSLVCVHVCHEQKITRLN